MAQPFEVVSVLVALEFVVLSAVVRLLVLFEVAAPLVPLYPVFLLVLSLSVVGRPRPEASFRPPSPEQSSAETAVFTTTELFESKE